MLIIGKFKDLTGEKHYSLLVVKRAENKNKQTRWLCLCDCGNEVIVAGGNLKNGHTKSCGCLGAKTCSKKMTEYNIKHSMCGTRFYEIWHSLKNRCKNRSHIHYQSYGGRGIKVCDEWANNFEQFMKDMYESYLEHIEIHGENNTSIDRINLDYGYSKDNCKWSTRIEQQNNKRNNIIVYLENNQYTLAQLARKYGICYDTISSRYRRGCRNYDLITPVKRIGEAVDNR